MSHWAENGTIPLPKSSPVRNREGPPESEQRERKRGASGSGVESVAKRRKRTFSAAEKLRIVKRVDECLATGKRGGVEAILREEGMYSSLLSAWRAQLGERGAAGLEARKPGRRPKLDAKERLNAELVKRNAELERKLRVAMALIGLQKKAHELLGIALPESDGES